MSPAQRDRDATKEKLIRAVETLIAREGFGAVRINAVAREAGVDKVLIYRYFGDMAGLLAAYGEQGDFWWHADDMLTEPLPGPPEGTLAACVARLFERHVAFLRCHPVTLEILAWETAERNELTVALETVREQRGMAMMRGVAERFDIDEAELLRGVGPIMTLLGAAGNYLAARGRHIRIFNGIDLQSDAGWDTLLRGAEQMIAGVLPAGSARLSDL